MKNPFQPATKWLQIWSSENGKSSGYQLPNLTSKMTNKGPCYHRPLGSGVFLVIWLWICFWSAKFGSWGPPVTSTITYINALPDLPQSHCWQWVWVISYPLLFLAFLVYYIIFSVFVPLKYSFNLSEVKNLWTPMDCNVIFSRSNWRWWYICSTQ